jgi:hypothetical protein
MSMLKEPRENSETENSTHAYTVQFAPRNWSGRLVVGLVLATLLFLVLLFFSMFLALGAVIIGLAVVVGIFKYVTGRSGSEGMRTERDGTNFIDTERSPEDGVYRPRNSSDPRDQG